MPRKAPKPGSHAVQKWPWSVMAVCAATGLLFVTAAVSARGDDLRPSGGDLTSLLSERAQRNEDRRDTAQELRSSIDDLSQGVGGTLLADLQKQIGGLSLVTGLAETRGPGLRVALEDAPKSADRPGLDPRVLVVHEQDIQAFVNALWAGGAEAITLQGQRLISTTGIKCVGNTVLLDGVPYAPPYVIEAVGDADQMAESVRTTPATSTFADYSREYGLGLSVERRDTIDAPAYAGQVALRYAEAVPDQS